jgi:hypothetical protein
MVRPARLHAFDQVADAPELVLVRCVGPHQINTLEDGCVTVTHPVGSDTVLSVQPDGTLETRPAGTAGPSERALRKPDRLVYAPLGEAGQAFLIPYTETIPNV